MANIAVGGVNSRNTFIVNNLIAGSQTEGIYLFRSEDCLITRNTIEQNTNGIYVKNS
jgi:F-box protein 11